MQTNMKLMHMKLRELTAKNVWQQVWTGVISRVLTTPQMRTAAGKVSWQLDNQILSQVRSQVWQIGGQIRNAIVLVDDL